MEENGAESTSLSEHDIRLADCICPICMSIVIEPVTMPCFHELCRPCFRDTVEQVNFTCPLCRLRISNWARKQAKVNKLINWPRWKEIQTAFPEQIRKRLEDEDNDYVLQPVNPIRVSKPGEVREEYEQEVKKHQIEREEEEKIEKEKSQKVIREIQEEELRQYEKRQQEEEKLRALDEEFARNLADSEENEIHVVGSLADEQARLDEQLARALQDEQKLTLQDEEFARKLQEELEKEAAISTSQSSNKYLIPSSKKNAKIPATNIERFFKKAQLGESPRSRPCSTSGGSTKDDLPSVDVLENPSDAKPERNSPEITCSGLQISDVVSVDSNSDSPMFLGPSTSKVIGRADISLVCVEDYNDDLGMEFDENSNSTFKHAEDMEVSVVGEETLSLFDECAILETKDLTSSPVSVINISPPTDLEDDETRSNQEEVVTKATGAFSPIAKTPPSGIPRKNAFRSDSVGSNDSISHEFSHFRPVVISPRTAARKLAFGKRSSPTLVHSTPKNLQKTLEEGESAIIQKSPLLMAKWLSLAQEREEKVLIGSKSVMVGKSVLQEGNDEKSSNIEESLNSTSLLAIGDKEDKDKSSNLCENSTAATETKMASNAGEDQEEDQNTGISNGQSSDTIKLSPGKVYRMKSKVPSHAKRKNLAKMWSSVNDNSEVLTRKCPGKDVKFDKSLLNKIVNQKDDENRKVDEVKMDDVDENEDGLQKEFDKGSLSEIVSHEYDGNTKVDEVKMDDQNEDGIQSKFDKSFLNRIVKQKDDKNRKIEEVKIDDNEDGIQNTDDKFVNRKLDSNNKRSISNTNSDIAEETFVKDVPSKVHSEEKNVKKKNQNEEKGRRKQHIDIKNCKTIEEMFAKFKKKLENEDKKCVDNNLLESQTNSIAQSKDNDNEKTFMRPSPVQDHQILLLNQTLSFKHKEKFSSPSKTLSCNVVETGNKRKRDETMDGQRKLKLKQTPLYSSPKKTQLLGLSASPKKAKLKALKGKTRTDNEPLSPGSVKHNRFVKLQTKEERRLQQEEIDRKIALKLQREINREMKAERNKVNRSHGSESEYPLRSRKPIYKRVVSNLP